MAFFCSGIQLYVLLSPYYLDLYMLKDDKLGIFHAKKAFMCIDPYQN